MLHLRPIKHKKDKKFFWDFTKWKNKFNKEHVGIIKFSLKYYKLFFFFFRYLILKDFIRINYKILIYHYDLNIYSEVINSRSIIHYYFLRFYFLFYFLLLLNKNFEFIVLKKYYNFIYYYSTDIYNKKVYFYYHDYTFFLLYLLRYSSNFFFLFYTNKFAFYRYSLFKTIFFFDEFFLRVEGQYFISYRKYVEYFRKFKYNEYMANNIIFEQYPFIRRLLFEKRGIRYDLIYAFRKITVLRRNYLIYFFKSLGLDISNEFFLDFLYESNILNKKNDYFFDREILFCLKNNHFFLFLRLLKDKFCFLIIHLFKYQFNIYLLSYSYFVYYISQRKRANKSDKFRYLLDIYGRFIWFSFDLISAFFFFFLKYQVKFLLKNVFILNFGFIYYFFLQNNKFLFNFITKDFLLYRIVKLLIVSRLHSIYDKFNWELETEYIKDPLNKGLDNTKLWSRQIRRKRLRMRIWWHGNKRTKCKDRIYKSPPLFYITKRFPINNNRIFRRILDIFYYLKILKFCDIFLLFNENENYWLSLLMQIRNNFEFIFWEIFNGNNKLYKARSGLNKKKIIKTFKINLLVDKFYNRFFFHLISIILEFDIKGWVNRSFFYFFFRDFFFQIFSLNNKAIINFLKNFFRLNFSIQNKLKNFHYKFFLWKLSNFYSKERFTIYCRNNYSYLMEEFEYNFWKKFSRKKKEKPRKRLLKFILKRQLLLAELEHKRALGLL